MSGTPWLCSSRLFDRNLAFLATLCFEFTHFSPLPKFTKHEYNFNDGFSCQVLGDRGFPGLRKLRALDLSNSPRLNLVSAQAFQVFLCHTPGNDFLSPSRNWLRTTLWAITLYTSHLPGPLKPCLAQPLWLSKPLPSVWSPPASHWPSHCSPGRPWLDTNWQVLPHTVLPSHLSYVPCPLDIRW